MRINAGRWIAFGSLLLAAAALLGARAQGLVTDAAGSVIMAILLGIAIAVGVVTSLRRHTKARSRRHSE
jgi:hypothetical protein